MTDDEWLARRERIQNAVVMSNNRVKDFIELVATLCSERTTSKQARHTAQMAPDSMFHSVHGMLGDGAYSRRRS